VATAIRERESRAGLARLAEDSGLRQVATGGAWVPPEELFAAITAEAGRVLSVEYAALSRYEPDGGVTVAPSGAGGARRSLGSRLNLEGNNIGTLVFETGRAARIENYVDASGRW